jgi:ribonuclease HII
MTDREQEPPPTSSKAAKPPLMWSHCLDGGVNEIGLDEAGRGALCGPVFAAAVVWGRSDDREREAALRADPRMKLVRDSKKLSPAQREKARAFIEAEALAWGVGSVEAAEIDKINILKASMRAMRLALDGGLRPPGPPSLGNTVHAEEPCRAKPLELSNDGGQSLNLLVDGDRFDGYIDPASGEFLPYTCVPEADGLYLSVAAASILAKTHRDAHVVANLHPRFPAYGWDRNKGYGTAEHIRAIVEKGPCTEHRRTFAPCRGGSKANLPFSK